MISTSRTIAPVSNPERSYYHPARVTPTRETGLPITAVNDFHVAGFGHACSQRFPGIFSDVNASHTAALKAERCAFAGCTMSPMRLKFVRIKSTRSMPRRVLTRRTFRGQDVGKQLCSRVYCLNRPQSVSKTFPTHHIHLKVWRRTLLSSLQHCIHPIRSDSTLRALTIDNHIRSIIDSVRDANYTHKILFSARIVGSERPVPER